MTLDFGNFTEWKIVRRRSHPLSEVAFRTKQGIRNRDLGVDRNDILEGNLVGSQGSDLRMGRSSDLGVRVTEYRVTQELGLQNVGGRWIAFDRCDGRQRLNRYRRLPVDEQIKFLYPRGRLISNFPRSRLLEIAWKAGVSNPEGFAKSDCEFFDMAEEDGFALFLRGWASIQKSTLCNYIWNYLYDNHAVYSYF